MKKIALILAIIALLGYSIFTWSNIYDDFNERFNPPSPKSLFLLPWTLSHKNKNRGYYTRLTNTLFKKLITNKWLDH